MWATGWYPTRQRRHLDTDTTQQEPKALYVASTPPIDDPGRSAEGEWMATTTLLLRRGWAKSNDCSTSACGNGGGGGFVYVRSGIAGGSAMDSAKKLLDLPTEIGYN